MSEQGCPVAGQRVGDLSAAVTEFGACAAGFDDHEADAERSDFLRD